MLFATGSMWAPRKYVARNAKCRLGNCIGDIVEIPHTSVVTILKRSDGEYIKCFVSPFGVVFVHDTWFSHETFADCCLVRIA